MMSVPRPGPVGTISRIGRVGQFGGVVCACTRVPPAAASQNDAEQRVQDLLHERQSSLPFANQV